ncbi:phage major capsid protein [Micromonospora endolithica]|uniref:Phage major capsid protein n=1 Tax=Micromonospora endolithica TaxID=230091 RepID=A0A3A9YT37_9ACTN|nr:phage major capsid protein [Micromonospora endolithica]RKN38457.1 phage major capsid protein [Micromonospora endolithica]TWJ23123.1 HK97 family phage major capsid protein [Micromonospora endolithica]
MPTTQQLREQRANIWDQMKALIAKDERTAEDNQTYARLEEKYDALDADIELQERHEAREKANNAVDRRGVVPPSGEQPSDTDAAYAAAFRAYLRDGLSALDPSDQALMRTRFEQIKNAAGVGTGAAGGYLVPPEFRDTVIETMRWYGPMLEVAEVITTDTGATLPWPTNDDTANVGAILGENTAMTEQDVTIGTADIGAYMYTSKLVRASYQLMQDRPDFDTWLARKLGERIGRIWNQHFTTGTGTAQPDGIVTSATVGVTGTGSFATTGGISYDNAVDLVESLDPAYGGGQGLSWMMHQTARKAFRKLKNTQGDPMWQPSMQAGIPATLLDYPVRLNNDMPTLATSSKSILFGNIREAYVIRKVRDIQTVRLNERYAEFLQVGFFGFARADGTMQNTSAVRVFQTTATA